MFFLHAISTLSNHCPDKVTMLTLCKPKGAHKARILPTATLNLNNFTRTQTPQHIKYFLKFNSGVTRENKYREVNRKKNPLFSINNIYFSVTFMFLAHISILSVALITFRSMFVIPESFGKSRNSRWLPFGNTDIIIT